MIVLLLTIHTAFAYGVIFSFFLSFKYVLVSEYQFTDQEASLSYISLVLGYVFAIILFILIERVSEGGECPEKQLHGSIAGGVLLLIGEIWSVTFSGAAVFLQSTHKGRYALAAHLGAEWPVMIAAGIPVGSGAFMLFVSTKSRN
jgi:hypothetical protein